MLTKARPALVSGDGLASWPVMLAPAARNRLPGRRHRVQGQARGRRALAARHRSSHGALPRRSTAARSHRLNPDHAVVRVGRAAARRARHSDGGGQAGRRRDLQDHLRVDPPHLQVDDRPRASDHAPRAAGMLAEYVLFAAGLTTHGALAARSFTRPIPLPDARQYFSTTSSSSSSGSRRAAAHLPGFSRPATRPPQTLTSRGHKTITPRSRRPAWRSNPIISFTDEDRIAAHSTARHAPIRGAAGAGAISSRRSTAWRRLAMTMSSQKP